jgi:pyrroloquinoline quinone biosynthesis protein D
VRIAGTDIPYLPRGVRLRHCDVRDGWFLLAPERAVKLDQVGAHVLEALDGSRDFAGVVAHLAQKFDAPPERIAEDAGRFLDDMRARRMVEVGSAPDHENPSCPGSTGASRGVEKDRPVEPGDDGKRGMQGDGVK